ALPICPSWGHSARRARYPAPVFATRYPPGDPSGCATIAPPALESSGACARAMVTSPSTAAARLTERFGAIRRTHANFAASGTSAAVFIIDRRKRSVISVVRGAELDPLLDHPERRGTGRARRGSGLARAKGRIGARQLQRGDEKGGAGIARPHQHEAARAAEAVRGRRVA